MSDNNSRIPTLSDAGPLQFGILAFALAVYAFRYITVNDTTVGAGPLSLAVTYAILAAAIGQTLGGVLSLARGDAFAGWVCALFGVWLFGFYMLIVHTDDAALSDKGIVATGADGKALSEDVHNALGAANVSAWHAESLAFFVLILMVPLAIFAIQPFRDRNLPFMLAFSGVLVVLLTLALGLHSAYATITDVTRGHQPTPDFGTAVGLLRLSGWSAAVGAVAVFWIFTQHVYPKAAVHAAAPEVAVEAA